MGSQSVLPNRLASMPPPGRAAVRWRRRRRRAASTSRGAELPPPTVSSSFGVNSFTGSCPPVSPSRHRPAVRAARARSCPAGGFRRPWAESQYASRFHVLCRSNRAARGPRRVRTRRRAAARRSSVPLRARLDGLTGGFEGGEPRGPPRGRTARPPLSPPPRRGHEFERHRFQGTAFGELGQAVEGLQAGREGARLVHGEPYGAGQVQVLGDENVVIVPLDVQQIVGVAFRQAPSRSGFAGRPRAPCG